jgi:hypothetical protein
MPGIHVLAILPQERRGWPGIGERKRRRPSDVYGPAMTESEYFLESAGGGVSITATKKNGAAGNIAAPSLFT